MPSAIVTATLQAAALSTASNFLAQLIEAHQEGRAISLDLIQLLRFVTLTLITAPPNYLWQQLLERAFPAYPAPTTNNGPQGSYEMGERGGGSSRDLEKQQQASDADNIGTGGSQNNQQAANGQPSGFSLKNTLAKWFIDCMTVGALLNTIVFFLLMGFMKGQPFSHICSNVKTQTIPMIVAGYKIWPLASIISFTFIPVHRRIVFLSFIGLIWGIYLSLVAARV